MNAFRTALCAVPALVLPALALDARAQFREEPDPTEISVSGRTPETVILAWPTESYRLARAMIAKYGQPTEFRDSAITWLDNGPWKKTVVYRYAPPGRVFGRGDSRLEQSAVYRMPPNKLEVLARFDREIRADAEEGRLTARSSSESENILALNLAHEVISGKRTVLEAADLRKKLPRLRDAGKSSPLLERLVFMPDDQFANPESPD